MLLGLYMSAAGMQAQEYRQAVTANNLANAQVTGFKRDLAMVQSRLNAVQEDPTMAQYRMDPFDQQGGGVNMLATTIDMAQGTLQQTGNQTDLALQGPGLFTVRGSDGKTALTRDGRFLIKDDGTLVTATGGNAVLDASGQPITLNPQLPVLVNEKGQISQSADAGNGVQLGIREVTDPKSLEKLGGNLLSAPDAAMRPASTETIVRQGSLENSGVDPVVEMVNMMEGQRVFEANAKMISFQDQTLQQINTIGRVA